MSEEYNEGYRSGYENGYENATENYRKLVENRDDRIAVLEAALKDLIEDHEHLTGRGADEDNWARGNARAALEKKDE